MSNLDAPNEGQNQDERMARELAALGSQDTTAPMPENLRQGWETEGHLGKLEKSIGYDAKQWDRFALLCARAQHLTTSPDAAALFQVGHLNGTRRAPQPDWTLVSQLLQEASTSIERLDVSTRKTRLQELFSYHRGITARYTGDYAAAAAYQRDLAQNSDSRGDAVGAAIGQLSERVDTVSLALARGENPLPLFASLEKAAQRVVDTCVDDHNPTQTQWRYFSAPVHVLEAYIWSGQPIGIEKQSYWLDVLTKDFPQKDPKQFENLQPTITAVRAGLDMLKGDFAAAISGAEKVLAMPAGVAMPNARATALLVLRMAGRGEQYLEHGVFETTCGYMHQVVATIRRLEESRRG